MPKKKTSKSEKLPKVGDSLRSFLIEHLPEFPDYQQSIDKGIRLFTRQELEELKQRYKNGMLWDDLEREFAQKGIPIKKTTIRKYIQDGYLSKPIGYRNVGRGRAALFSSDTISQINFIYYFYKVASGDIVDEFLNTIRNLKRTYYDKAEAYLTSSDYLYPALLRYICFDDDEAYNAIEQASSCHHQDQQKLLSMLDGIKREFKDVIETKINKLISVLQKDSITDLHIKNQNNEEKMQ